MRREGGYLREGAAHRYPQGAEKQLIYGCTGRVVPEGGLPVDAGAVVVNVHTALAIFRAVQENTPCYERIMTVSGGAAARPQNLWVPNGTPLRDIAEYCGGDENCARMVLGGPMMGDAVFSLKVCTAKTTSSLLFLTEKECESRVASVCIGCGRCVQACPMGLLPYTSRPRFSRRTTRRRSAAARLPASGAGAVRMCAPPSVISRRASGSQKRS